MVWLTGTYIRASICIMQLAECGINTAMMRVSFGRRLDQMSTIAYDIMYETHTVLLSLELPHSKWLRG